MRDGTPLATRVFYPEGEGPWPSVVYRTPYDQGSEFFLDFYEMPPYEDEFWASQQVKDEYNRARVPMLHVSGWFDIFTQGTLDAVSGFQHEGGDGARGRQKLIIGPWVHGDLGVSRDQGELRYPERSRSAPISRDSVYAAMLSEAFSLDEPISFGAPVVAFDEVPAVQYYVMGDVRNETAPGNEWRSADDWPPPAVAARLYLHGGGELSEGCPSGGSSAYLFDPDSPSPAVSSAYRDWAQSWCLSLRSPLRSRQLRRRRDPPHRLRRCRRRCTRVASVGSPRTRRRRHTGRARLRRPVLDRATVRGPSLCGSNRDTLLLPVAIL